MNHMHAKARLPTSWLFVPGDDPRKLARGFAAGAGALILDWEDAVAAGRKDEARRITIEALATPLQGATQRWLRVNGTATAHFEADLAALPAAGIQGIVLPKSCGPEAIVALDARLARVEHAQGLAGGSLGIVAVATEDAASVLALTRFAGALPRLTALMWGGEDLSADLGLRHNRGEGGRYKPPFRLARELTLLAAAAAGAAAIDAVFTDVHDTEGLAAECREARADGFSGKAAIHPRQLKPIDEAFAPTPDELAWARRVVDVLKDGQGVSLLDGQMVDRPHLRLARRLLGLPPD